MGIVNPSAIAQFPGTEVFAAASAAPVAFTDLDISAVVGARAAVVILRYYNATGANRTMHFRTNGATWIEADPGNLTAVNVANGRTAHFILTTDTAGIIEWYADAVTAGATITVEAYIA